jgi:hypothetical protein
MADEINWSGLEEKLSKKHGCSLELMRGRPSRKQIRDRHEIARGIAAVRQAYAANPGASEEVVKEQAYKILGLSLTAIFFQFIFPVLAKLAVNWVISQLNLPKGSSSDDRVYG